MSQLGCRLQSLHRVRLPNARQSRAVVKRMPTQEMGTSYLGNPRVDATEHEKRAEKSGHKVSHAIAVELC